MASNNIFPGKELIGKEYVLPIMSLGVKLLKLCLFKIKYIGVTVVNEIR